MIEECKDRSVTIRMNSNDYQYLAALAYITGMSVSAYIRTLAQASVNAAKASEAKGAFKLEDIKTILDDKL